MSCTGKCSGLWVLLSRGITTPARSTPSPILHISGPGGPVLPASPLTPSTLIQPTCRAALPCRDGPVRPLSRQGPG